MKRYWHFLERLGRGLFAVILRHVSGRIDNDQKNFSQNKLWFHRNSD